MADEQRNLLTDPTAWKAQFDEAVRQWNDFLSGMMGTESYAAAMGRFMDGYLDFQRSVSQNVERQLESLGVPTRSDFTRLAERLAALEARLDSVERKLDSQTQVRPSRPAIPEASVG